MSDADDDDETSHVQHFVPLPPDDEPQKAAAPTEVPSEKGILLRAIFSHPVFAICFPAALGCLVGIWFSNGDPEIMIPALAFGWVLVVVAWWSLKEISKPWTIAWIVISTIILGWAAAFVYWHAHPDWHPFGAPSVAYVKPPAPAASSSLDNRIALNCYLSEMPSVVPPDARLAFMEMFPARTLGFGGLIGKNPGDSLTWAHQNSWRCEIANFNTAPVFHVKLRFRASYSMPIGKNGSCAIEDKKISSYDWPAGIAQLAANGENPFVFYVWNASQTCAWLDIPTSVQVTTLGSNFLETTRLIQPNVANIVLGPELPKASALEPQTAQGKRGSKAELDKPPHTTSQSGSPGLSVTNPIQSIIAPNNRAPITQNNFGPPHDPNRFYYDGRDVGSGTGATLSADGKSMTFASFETANGFSGDEEFSYGEHTLAHCRGHGYGTMGFGAYSTTTLGPPITCIVEK